ncbi:MAG TPA: RHS repeat-associated core domain-containing protein [Pyrinomonadaceae bacterium]|nr:RHS repeat-associated core domain-containing protein [Pyrinomonadaceae bacterium]
MRKRVTFGFNLILALYLACGQLMAFARDPKRIELPRRAERIAPTRFAKPPASKAVQTLEKPEGQSATLLQDGRWLLLGGEGKDGPGAKAEIQDDRSGTTIVLATELHSARAWHTATMLPDGRVLILGGIGGDQSVIETAELFDPETQTFQKLSVKGLTVRAYHTATLMTDGRVLVAGGSDQKGRLLNKLELWDPENRKVTVLDARSQFPRKKATAHLRADGTVLLSGGTNSEGEPLSDGEIYDPESQTVIWTGSPQDLRDNDELRLEFSSPGNGAMDVDPNTRIALRFSTGLQVESVSPETVTLLGPHRAVATKVVPAEQGILAFITPLAPLAVDSSYHLTIDKATDKKNRPLPYTTVGFKTKGDGSIPNEKMCGTAPQIIDGDSWIPEVKHLKGDWRSGRPEAQAGSLPALEAAAGETALSGQVLALSGNPLANVTLQIGDKTTVTDHTGRFLLSSLQSGRHGLTIHGHSASRPGKTYGTFDVLVDIAAGKTTVLSYKIWLPVLDEQNAVSLSIPTNRETAVTTPRVPGMEVRIPGAAVLRMPSGMHHMAAHTRRELTKVAITPIPVDRPPFPLPPGVTDGLLYTLQLHGARVEGPNGEKRPGLRIIFPNYQNLPAGARVDFWNYDSSGVGWYLYGRGTVTPDRRQVVPDPGVELQSMYCVSIMVPWAQGPGPAGAPGNNTFGADPVDLGTGFFVYHKTDLALPDVMPIVLSRTYRQMDTRPRGFGIGISHPYEMIIVGDSSSVGDLILPDGGRIRYNHDPARTDGVWGEHTATPTEFYKSTLSLNNGSSMSWDIKLRNGTVMHFGITPGVFGVGGNTSLESITDRYGNKITITASKIISPNGRWVEFTRDPNNFNFITQARDNIGRTVSYTYDANLRLWKVTDAGGGITEYTYDSAGRMTTIKDPRGVVYLTNEYDPSSGRITRQTLADTGVFQFAYVVGGSGNVTQTDVTDPRGHVRRATFNSSGYTLTDTLALGLPEQQTYSYERQAGTNFILSVTDPLSRKTAMTYDAQGNITSVTRLADTPDAVTATMTYEPIFGNLASLTDPLNHTASLAYDSTGKLITATDPLNQQTTFTYNAAGQLLTATDPSQRIVQFTYDSGDLVAITDSLNRTVTRYIDAAGRLTRTANTLGDATRYEYDNLNHPTRGIDPLQGVTASAYDPNGNVLSITDARNSVTSYIYDNMDRVITRRDPLLRDETYEYDLNGNLKKVTDRKGQITNFTYDALDRRTQVSYADTSTTTYSYDSVNRLTQVVDSLSGTITYGYDNLDRLTSETTPQGSVNYTYDAAGRRTSMTVAGQPTVNYTYDNANRLTQITQGSSIVTLAYDAIGRRTSLTLPNGVITEYGYDLASQLTSLTYKLGQTVLGDLTYEYDAAGRRTRMGGSFARSLTPRALASATYNASNQQLTFDSQTLSYDLNGNLTNDSENTYTWDARDRLASVTGPGVNATFQYDATGSRSSKTINGTTTSFLYAGANVVQEQSSQTGNANVLSGGIDEVYTRSDATGTWSPLVDGLGSLLSLTDASGALQTEYSYGAFGSSTSPGPSNSNVTQYTGRENDGTGLYFNRGRYYSPQLQRFLSEDPIGMAGGINLYAYVENNPISFTDPFGTDKIDLGWLILAHGAQVAAGFGDNITRGLADTAVMLANGQGGCGCAMLPPGWSPIGALRGLTPGGAAVDPSSTGYGVGQGLAVAWGAAMAVAGAAGMPRGGGPTWPRSAAAMDDMLGIQGTRIPDGAFIGRNKVMWQTSDHVKITFEQHPYHPNAPSWHRGPHYHLYTPAGRQRYLPGDPLP